jgi:glutaredoxin 3
MSKKRLVEIFTAGCPVCDTVVQAVTQAACPSCDVIVLDVQDTAIAERAQRLGVRCVPAVAIDGELAGCCQAGGPDLRVLRHAGLGQPT